MDFEVPDCEPEECFKGGGGIPGAGWHHAQVGEVEETEESIKMKFHVLAGPDAGKGWTEWFHLHSDRGEESQKKLYQRIIGVALRLRVITPQYYTDCKQRGQRMSIDFRNAVGAQCMLELWLDNKAQDRDGNVKPRIRLRFDGIHALDDKNVPPGTAIDWETAGLWGHKPDDPFGKPAAAATPAAAPARQQPAMAGATAGNGGGSIYDQI